MSAAANSLSRILGSLRSGLIPTNVCRECMLLFEAALRSGSAIDEQVCEFFRILSSSENPKQLMDVLTEDLPPRYQKIGYYLRVYALRSLIRDKALQLTGGILAKIAGTKDVGRLAVIDFILTRQQPTDDQIRLLRDLTGGLEDSHALSSKYSKRLAALTKLQCTLDNDVDLQSTYTLEALNSQIDKIPRCSPRAIRDWIRSLTRDNVAEPEKFSVQLVNLGVRVKTDVSVIIWSGALHLEDPERPTKYVFAKVWRLMLALNHFPQADFSALSLGLELCLRRLGLSPTAELVDNLDSFADITAALLKSVSRWPVLVDTLKGEFRPLIARLLIQLISTASGLKKPVPQIGNRELDRLMEISAFKKLSRANSVKIQWAYCSLFNKVYDCSHLLSFKKADISIWIMLAKHHRRTPVEAYKWCKLIARSCQKSLETAPLFKELYFYDLLPQFTFHHEIPLETLRGKREEFSNSGAEAASLMDYFVRSWHLLNWEGCHADALRCLVTAFSISHRFWGANAMRTMVCHKLLERYADALQVPASELYHDSLVGSYTCEVPPCLEQSFNACLKLLWPYNAESETICSIPWVKRLELARRSDSSDLFFRVSGSPLYASRAYHTGRSGEISQKFVIPENHLCLCFDFDDSVLTIRKYEGARRDILRVPLTRPLQDMLCELDESVQDSVKATTKDAADFWQDQYARDRKFGLLCAEIEKHLFGEFLGFLRAQNESRTLHFKQLNSRELMMLQFAYHYKSPAISKGELFPDLVDRYASEMQNELREYLAQHPPTEDMSKIVLVCDRQSSSIPWESLPFFRSRVVTRALSLRHLQELLVDGHPQQTPQVTYLVNPEQNLPDTYLPLLKRFKLRGWTGKHKEFPTESELREQLQSATDFVYVGHGSGQKFLQGSDLRRMYESPSNVYLLGCSSVAIKWPLLDTDVLTDYAVKGSRIIIGNLWAVKDKDFNRFSAEFLSRVFDEGQPIGEALQASRSVCALPYLTGGSLVVYGLP